MSRDSRNAGECVSNRDLSTSDKTVTNGKRERERERERGLNDLPTDCPPLLPLLCNDDKGEKRTSANANGAGEGGSPSRERGICIVS